MQVFKGITAAVEIGLLSGGRDGNVQWQDFKCMKAQRETKQKPRGNKH